MASVIALIPDLLFGSRAVELLRAAGHEVRLVATPAAAGAAGAEVVVADLTQGDLDVAEVVAARGSARLLGFYAHVEPAVRDRALAAGFDQVVPRSRFNREGGALVTRLAGGA